MSTRAADYRDKEALNDFYRRLKPEGTRLLLSVDGGGSRGYITLHCLVRLEELTGRKCYEIFDFFTGTSTGSLIAAGLAVEKSAQQLRDLYEEHIPKVFDESKQASFIARACIEIGARTLNALRLLPPGQLNKLEQYARLLARNEWKYMYSHQKLKEICELMLRDRDNNPVSFGDLYQRSVDASNGQHTKRLMVTVKDVQRGETLFMVNAGPGGEAFEDMPLVNAVVASSVAPVFLEPFGVWVDGGVGSYANPCYEATVEATEYFTGLRKPGYKLRHDDAAYHHDNVIHFSFGTGMRPVNIRDEPGVQQMLFHDWLLYLIFEAQDDANAEQVRHTQERFSRGNNWYSSQVNHKQVDFRRYQLVLDPKTLMKPVAEGGLGMMLSYRDQELVEGLEMNSNSPEELDLMARIGQAWADAIGEDFARPHYPYAGETAAYVPPASPQRQALPGLKGYVALKARSTA